MGRHIKLFEHFYITLKISIYRMHYNILLHNFQGETADLRKIIYTLCILCHNTSLLAGLSRFA